MASALSPEQSVARIAYLASHVLVAVTPPGVAQSPIPSHEYLKTLSTPNLVSHSRKTEVQFVRSSNDPLLSAFQPAQQGRLASVLGKSDILLPAIPHLAKLAHLPVVFHVALTPEEFPDYSVVAALRNTGLILLQSQSALEAQDIALAAHALAIRTGKAVLHFLPAQTQDQSSLSPITTEQALEVLGSDTLGPYKIDPASPAYPQPLYADDGHRAWAVPQSSNPLPASGTLDFSPQQAAAAAAANAIDTATTSSATSSAASVSSSRSDNPETQLASPATTVDSTLETVGSDFVFESLVAIFAKVKQQVDRQYSPLEKHGDATAATDVVLVFGSYAATLARVRDQYKATTPLYSQSLIAFPRLYRPLNPDRFFESLPPTVVRIAVLEQLHHQTTKWGPTFLDVLSAAAKSHSTTTANYTIVGHRLGHLVDEDAAQQALKGVLQNLTLPTPLQNLEVGSSARPAVSLAKVANAAAFHPPKVETAYSKILDQLFGSRLHIANTLRSHAGNVSAALATSPEFGFGSLLARKDRRGRFVDEVRQVAAERSGEFTSEVVPRWLSKWVLQDPQNLSAELSEEVLARLEVDGSSIAQQLLTDRGLFRKESLWLMGSDAWAYDLGNSGVHHVLASGENINLLIIDSTPYSERDAADSSRRKKDIGLYAMNFGNVYVASTAVYSSYSQVLQAMIEADQFQGPSVVLAYLPYFGEHESALQILQETKKAVETGYWPLYRWNPANETTKDGEPNFTLDSDLLKRELKAFLDRDNHLTQLMKKQPEFAANLAQDFGTEVRNLQKRKAKDAYDQLLEGLYGAPLTVLYASDNGNGTTVANRLQRRARARGLKAKVLAMEDYPVEDLPTEENIVFISSTAGQGEFPQNGRPLWDALKDNTGLDLATVKYSVFGLGDSHYWPRKEDRIYYNKPAKDLDRVLTNLGASKLAEVGLGDDQDPDGFQTGYSTWEPKIWEALGVANVQGLPDEPPPITNEDIKVNSNFLRGTIAEGLKDTSTGAISAADQQLTKFHGTYMQDDRDVRDERKGQGLEPAYSFMIRCRLPGGVATPKQWIQMDDISSTLGNQTMKLTTRQTFQFHGVVKGKLKPAMQAINRALMDTLAACGDVNRNVMCSSLPTQSKFHREVHEYSRKISEHLLPSTQAYHEIWLTDDDNKKTQIAGDAVQDFEPLYGPTYLPRKFKITIAVPPHNDTDVYAHDIGLIAIKDNDTGSLAGFNVLVGGGMGTTHNNKKTYPQLGRAIGFVRAEDAPAACEKIMLIQRDHGDRKNRKHARLKYTIDDMGLDVFRAKVEAIWGRAFEQPPRPFHFDSNVDSFGWQEDEEGLHHFTMFIENGRIEDTADHAMKTGLRELARVHKGEFRLTANQHLIVSNVATAEKPVIEEVLARFHLDTLAYSGLRLSSAACVAFPTCGLAMAESERYLPQLISKVEGLLEENGLRQDSITMRMTGCPNGCARPWLAEVAFVGKAYGVYNMYLGGGYHGQRLNKLYRSSIQEAEILQILSGLFRRYAQERLPADHAVSEWEHFGDFLIRVGVIQETFDGRDFHDGVEEEEEE